MDTDGEWSHSLAVVVTDQNDPQQTQLTSTTLTYVIAPALTSVSLSVGKPSPALVNTPITLTATATGGSPNLVYRFLASGNEIRGYGSVPSCTWTPTAPDPMRSPSPWKI